MTISVTSHDMLSCWIAAGPVRWFTKDPAFDATLRIRFGDALAKARMGAYGHWAASPEGALGLVILLDQVSRNIHRGSPLSFAADARALQVAKDAIAKGYHLRLPAPLAQWFIMPFEHAEDLDCQQRAVAHFTTMGLADMAHWARIHLDIIARFGRFPHRNSILGRRSSAEELKFLQAGGFAG